MSKKKDKKKKKKSQKGKSKKQLKKGKKKGGKRLAKKKSGKKSKKKKKSSEKTNDVIQPTATFAAGDSPLALTTNEEIQPMQATQSSDNGNYGSNYGVFEWDGSHWTLAENCCDYGCIPQQPTEPGTFVGERAVTACQAQVEGMSCPPSE